VRPAACALRTALLAFVVCSATLGNAAPPDFEALRAQATEQTLQAAQQASTLKAAGDNAKALAAAERAAFHAQVTTDPYLMFKAQVAVAELLEQSGQDRQALAPMKEAIFHLQALREVSDANALRDEESAAYSHYANLLLRQARVTADPQQAQGMLLQARGTIERFREAELRNYFRSDCVAVRNTNPDISALDKNAAIIYPIVFEDRTEILVDVGGKLYQSSLNVPAQTLREEVQRFIFNLGKRTTQEYKSSAKYFYDLMIRPIEPQLTQANVQTLVFVPDGPLRGIPLAALHDGKDFLINRWAVAVTPGLRLTDARKLQRKNLLLVGAVSDSVQGFPSLPSVTDEVQNIKGLYTGKSLINDAFDRNSFSHEMQVGNYDIVHIATHAQFRGSPKDTFLLAYADKIDLDDFQSALGSRRYSDHPISLVTLSACQTAVGNDKATLGLGGAAVKSGAQAVFASLWYIDDRAASDVVQNFYQHLSAGSGKAQALREAQLSMLADRRYRHPGYWSPFLLIGNWL
jgi:CHAT domain-containing protein